MTQNNSKSFGILQILIFLSFLLAITTVEGVLKRTIAGLMQDQPVRKHMDPDGAAQIDEYVARIEGLLTLAQPFHVVIEGH